MVDELGLDIEPNWTRFLKYSIYESSLVLLLDISIENLHIVGIVNLLRGNNIRTICFEGINGPRMLAEDL